jgi:hypothetical protein
MKLKTLEQEREEAVKISWNYSVFLCHIRPSRMEIKSEEDGFYIAVHMHAIYM